MLKPTKKKYDEDFSDAPPTKKGKKSVTIVEPNTEKKSKVTAPKKSKEIQGNKNKPAADSRNKNFTFKSKPGQNKFSSFGKDHNGKNKQFEKPADWNEFKKKKKEVQMKRRQSRNLYDVTVEAKKLGEKLRMKTVNKQERSKLTEELHSLLGGQNNYAKFVLTHDMARIVQYMLKFGSENIRQEIAKELIPATVPMLQSKYAKFCVKHMLKYGSCKTRSGVMTACYGSAVKLASHAVSAAIFDYGFTTWATKSEKRSLIQEFYGDLFKHSKDKTLTHVRDLYKENQDMKAGYLGAMKANLERIINKELLDSHIVQTVIMEYIQECNANDRNELISQLSSHIVILSNSKEGATAALTCFWYASNKERKLMMKSLKEHIASMCKHEHAHRTIIGILDSVDDTVLLNKVFVNDILSSAADLVSDEWGRKVLLWLVAPGNKTYFHPQFIKELEEGREKSGSKKSVENRISEILGYCLNPLLKQIAENTEVWMKNGAVGIATFAIIKAGKSGSELEEAVKSISALITNPEWKVVGESGEVSGIEDAAFHMLIKKLLQYDNAHEKLFAPALVQNLTEDTIKTWLKSENSCNRLCFLMVHILENSSDEVQDDLKKKIGKKSKKLLEQKEKLKGAEILLKKLT